MIKIDIVQGKLLLNGIPYAFPVETDALIGALGACKIQK
jgi:hypothetical protein